MKFLKVLALLSAAAWLHAQTPATVNVVTPTACLTSIDGVPMNGTLTVFAPGLNNQAAPFTSSTGLVVAGQASRTITAGQIVGTLVLPNPAVTSPVNVGYTFVISPNSSGTISRYASVFISPDGSGNWNLCSLQAGNYQTAFPTVFTGGGSNPPAGTGFVLVNNGAYGTPRTLASGDIPNNAANTSGTAGNLSGTPTLPNGVAAATQAAGDNSAKLATDAFALAQSRAQVAFSSRYSFPGSLFLGDSITCGAGATTFVACGLPNGGFAWLVGNLLGPPSSIQNEGQLGATMSDAITEHMLPNTNPQYAQQPTTFALEGINDANDFGAGANALSNYVAQMNAITAWTTTPAINKVMAQNCTLTPIGGGTISPNTLGHVLGVLFREADTVSCSITTTGGPIGVVYRAVASNASGTATLTIDGVSKGTLLSAGFGGQSFAGVSATQTEFAQTFAVAAGTHTVAVTGSMPNTGFLFGFDYVATPYTGPTVVGQPRLVWVGIPYYPLNDSGTATYYATEESTEATLAAQGWPVTFADVRSEMNDTTDVSASPQTCRDGSTTGGSLVAGHPNDCGYMAMRDVVLNTVAVNPVAYYQPNLTPTQYPAAVIGTPTFGAAKFSNGLTAVSDSNYLQTGAGLLSFGTTSSWTIDVWLKTTSTTGNQIAISTGVTGDPNYFWFGSVSGNFGGAILSGGATINSGIPIHDGAWHHCVVTVTGGTTAILLVDGAVGATATGTFGLPTHTNLTIGRLGAATGFAWSGSIDEVAVWSTAKYTGSYTVPTAPYLGTESGMLALYHLQADGTDSAQ